MKERLIDKIKRMISEKRDARYKRIIKKYVRKHDEINGYAFMAFSFGADEITDYHVIAERSYPDHHIFGTQVTWFTEKDREG